MSITLYDATVARFVHTLDATEKILHKGLDWCHENDHDPAELVAYRLRDDMLPFQFQIISVAHHSLGALRGVKEGTFSPPPSLDLDYAGLQGLVSDARAELALVDAEELNGLADGDLTFTTKKFQVDFVVKDFLLGFSVPNFYFHVTTAYDMLRIHGVALGKLDYLGALRGKS